MKIDHLHDWNLAPKAAAALQLELAPQLKSDVPLAFDRLETVAGVDVSVKGKVSRAAIVVVSYPQLEVIETASAQRETSFPYIPGLLAFREGPVILAALEQLRSEPGAFIFDGMGQMHPRRMGIAAHLGLWLQGPTVGCGKTRYIGDYVEPAPTKGSRSPLIYKGAQLGVVLRTRAGVKPVFVSVGHLADLESAARLALSTTTRYRLPEPVRAAHRLAGSSSMADD
ncbi:MAG: endonuclease V [Chloroflexi bacterium]|nr:endonuclease V [Chloroflexota bacterium]